MQAGNIRRKRRALCLLFTLCLLAAGALDGVWASYARRESAALETMRAPAPFAGEKRIALTFDDGPRASTTGVLLRELNRRGVRATFFVVGSLIEGNETLLSEMARSGQQIGIHTYDHVVLAGQSRAYQLAQIEKTKLRLHTILGEGDYMLRPPYGFWDETLCQICREEEMPLIVWSVDTLDWKHQHAQKLCDCLCGGLNDGDIVLMHDIFPSTVEGVLAAIDRLQEQGYRFVTLEELFALRGCHPECGQVYLSLPP